MTSVSAEVFVLVMLARKCSLFNNTGMSKNELHIPSFYDFGEMPTPSFSADVEGIKLANETDESYNAAYNEEPLTPAEEEALFVRSLDTRLSDLEVNITRLVAKRQELLGVISLLQQEN